MRLFERVFIDHDGMICLVLTGSMLPLASACGGAIGDSLSNEYAGAPNSTVTHGAGGLGANWRTGEPGGANGAGGMESGTSFGSGSGGTAFGSDGTASPNPGGSSAGPPSTSSDTTRAYCVSGNGSGTLAGYSSCSWDVANAVASTCGYTQREPDYHGIAMTLALGDSPQQYTLAARLPPEFYVGGGSVEVPVLTPNVSGVSVGGGYCCDAQGEFQFPVQLAGSIAQLRWISFNVTVSFTCGPQASAVSVHGLCGWGN